jgi:hypothetical protein
VLQTDAAEVLILSNVKNHGSGEGGIFQGSLVFCFYLFIVIMGYSDTFTQNSGALAFRFQGSSSIIVLQTDAAEVLILSNVAYFAFPWVQRTRTTGLERGESSKVPLFFVFIYLLLLWAFRFQGSSSIIVLQTDAAEVLILSNVAYFAYLLGKTERQGARVLEFPWVQRTRTTGLERGESSKVPLFFKVLPL